MKILLIIVIEIFFSFSWIYSNTFPLSINFSPIIETQLIGIEHIPLSIFWLYEFLVDNIIGLLTINLKYFPWHLTNCSIKLSI